MRNRVKRWSGLRLGIGAAALLGASVCWPTASVQAQDQQGEKPFKFHQDQDLYEFNRDLREKYGHIERGIEQDIEQVLRREQRAFSDVLQSLEAEQAIERCDLQALNALLQKLFDLERRLATLRETIANSFYNIDIALDAIERDALVRVMLSLCEAGTAQRVFEAPGLLDGPVRSLVERERNHLLYLKTRIDELLDQQRDLEEAVRTKLRDLISEFLRRCCGKERCGDASRPTTGSTERQPDAQTPGPSDQPRDASPPGGDGASLPPGGIDGSGAPSTSPPSQTTGDVSRPAAAMCCERCPGTDRDRFYFPVPPDTDCQPGDVRRDDLTLGEHGTCANPFTEEPGPATYGSACCAQTPAQVLYDSAQSGGVRSELGAVLRSACEDDPCTEETKAKLASEEVLRAAGPPLRLETSILSSGTDVQGRNWVPENPVLRLGKERLKPCHAEPFYVTKESSTNAAAVVLSAISIDYADDAHTAETSKGTSCTASHSGASNETRRRDTPQERAAKAAAIGLLASQAKGHIEGLRATFDVTGREAQLQDAKLQADVVNEVTQRKTSLSLPVRFDTSEQ